MNWIWKLIPNRCTGCGICADVCPSGAIRMSREMPLPRAVDGACTDCGSCVAECPFDSLDVRAAENPHREGTTRPESTSKPLPGGTPPSRRPSG